MIYPRYQEHHQELALQHRPHQGYSAELNTPPRHHLGCSPMPLSHTTAGRHADQYQPHNWNPLHFDPSQDKIQSTVAPSFRRRPLSTAFGNGGMTSAMFQLCEDIACSSSEDEDDYLLPIERPDNKKKTTARRPSKIHKPLAHNFQPSNYSVLIGRAKDCKEAIGNRRLKVLADLALPRYKDAEYKMEKTIVVSSIVETIQNACQHHGAFIKYAEGRWWEVDDASAREKVGYVLRDMLHDKYKSSSKAKSAVRRKSKEAQSRRESESSIKSTRST